MFKAIVVAAVIIAANSAAGQTQQDSASKVPRSWGGSYGHMFFPGGDVTFSVLALHATQFKSNGWGREFSLLTAPCLLIEEGAILLAPRFSAVRTFEARDGTRLFLKLGAGAAAAFDLESYFVLIGANAGAGALLPAGPRTALRLEIEPHFALLAPQYPIWMLSIGLTSR